MQNDDLADVVNNIYKLYEFYPSSLNLKDAENILGKNIVALRRTMANVFLSYVITNGYTCIEKVEEEFGLTQDIIQNIARDNNTTIPLPSLKEIIESRAPYKIVDEAFGHGIYSPTLISELSNLPYDKVKKYADKLQINLKEPNPYKNFFQVIKCYIDQDTTPDEKNLSPEPNQDFKSNEQDTKPGPVNHDLTRFLFERGAPLEVVQKLCGFSFEAVNSFLCSRKNLYETWEKNYEQFLDSAEQKGLAKSEYARNLIQSEDPGLLKLISSHLDNPEKNKPKAQESANTYKSNPEPSTSLDNIVTENDKRVSSDLRDELLKIGTPLSTIAYLENISNPTMSIYKNSRPELNAQWQENKRAFKVNAKESGLTPLEYLKQHYAHLLSEDTYNHKFNKQDETHHEDLTCKRQQLVDTLETIFSLYLPQEKQRIYENQKSSKEKPIEQKKLLTVLGKIKTLYREAEEFAQQTSKPEETYPLFRDYVVSLNTGPPYLTNTEIAKRNGLAPPKVSNALNSIKDPETGERYLPPLIAFEHNN